MRLVQTTITLMKVRVYCSFPVLVVLRHLTSNRPRLDANWTSIYGLSMAPSFYEVLGLTARCSAEDIRRAYHQAARKYHPDKRSHTSEEGEQLRFLCAQEAYETLGTEDRRRQYDAKLHHDELVRKRAQELVVISDEVPLADMRRQVLSGETSEEDEVFFTHQCRCGDLYEITDDELQDGVDVVPCTGCSLHIRVLSDGPTR